MRLTVEHVKQWLSKSIKNTESDLSNSLNENIRQYLEGKRNGYRFLLNCIIKNEIIEEAQIMSNPLPYEKTKKN